MLGVNEVRILRELVWLRGWMMDVECWLLINGAASEGTCLVGSLLGCCMLNDARRDSVVEWGIS